MKLLDECRELCLSCAPELARRPFHVVARDLGGAATGLSGWCLARVLGLPGAAIIVDLAALARSVPPFRAKARRREALRFAAFGTALHEAAHCLVERDWSDEPGPRQLEIAADQFAGIKSVKPADWSRGLVPWHQHGEDFIRVAFELCGRAIDLGVPLIPSDLLDTRFYGLSATWDYEAALEGCRHPGQPFADILAEPAPRKLAALFAADVELWLTPEPRKGMHKDLLASIKTALSRRQAAKVASLAELADAIADGKPADPEESAELLLSLGLAPADLDRAVAASRQRRVFEQQVVSGQEAEQELAKIAKTVRAADAELAKARAAHADIVGPLAARQMELEAARRAGRHAASQLRPSIEADLA